MSILRFELGISRSHGLTALPLSRWLFFASTRFVFGKSRLTLRCSALNCGFSTLVGSGLISGLAGFSGVLLGFGSSIAEFPACLVLTSKSLSRL